MLNKAAIPHVHKLETTEGDFDKNTDPTDTSLVVFTNSTTLLFAGERNRVVISQDNGVHWETAFEFECPKVKDPSNFLNKYIQLDDIYTDKRAFFFPQHETHNLRACCTNDTGRSWTSFDLYSAVREHFPFFFDVGSSSYVRLTRIRSSPLNENHLLASVSFNNNEECDTFSIDFLSLNFGKRWVPLLPAENIPFAKHIYSTKCFFGLVTGDLFCLLLKEEPLENEKQTEKDLIDDQTCTESGKLYHSKDMGNTWCLHSDLKDESVLVIDITEKYVIAYVAESDIDVWTCTRIYISTDCGKTFQKPKFGDVHNNASPDQIPYVNDAEPTNDVILLSTTAGNTWISDSTGLQFFLPTECGTQRDKTYSVQTLYNQPNTLLLTTKLTQTKTVSQGNCMHTFTIDKTRISFDNGKSWSAINLNLTNTSMKSHWKEKLADLTSYEFQTAGASDLSLAKNKPLEIFTLSGYLIGETKQMDKPVFLECTIVTRNGGKSFDLSLEVPLYVSIGNYGNILLGYSSERKSNKQEAKNKLYFSLDQGHSWDCFLLEENDEVVDVLPLKENGAGFQFLVCTYTTFSSEKACYKRYYVVDFCL
ncbi:hypothetical protein ACO0QE_002887 [Hanseniaspora vineae]